MNAKRNCERADARLTILMSHDLRQAVEQHKAAIEQQRQMRTSLSAAAESLLRQGLQYQATAD